MDVKVFSRENNDELPPGVNELVRVYVAQKRKIAQGDKMAAATATGCGSRIMPIEDMPSGRYGMSSIGMIRATTPLLPWRPAILSPWAIFRFCAT